MHRPDLLFSCIIILAASPPPLARASEPISPALALDEARAAYRAGPTAEHIRVTIRPDGKHDDFIVRLDPGKASEHTDASVAMEMGELRVWISRGQIIAAHQRDQKSCFIAEYTGPLTPQAIEQALPPIPIPEVWLLTTNPDPDSLRASKGVTPYTPVIAWDSAVAEDAADGGTVTVSGHTVASAPHTSGKVTLTTHSGRLLRFFAELEQGAQLTLDFEPVAPGDPRAWAIDPEGRARVAHISELKPRPGDVVVGNVAPELNLIDADHKPWSLPGEFSVARGEPATAAPSFLVLLLVSEPAEEQGDGPRAETPAADDAAAGERAFTALKVRLEHDRLVHTAGDKTELPPRIAGRTVLILRKIDGQSRAKVQAGAARWGDRMLWSASRATTIDRFMPGGDAAMIVIKPDRTVAGIIPLGGRAENQGQIESELEAVVAGKGGEPR
jgi:hypothetical protein